MVTRTAFEISGFEKKRPPKRMMIQLNKLSAMCHGILAIYEQKKNGGRMNLLACDGRHKEKNLRLWLTRNFPQLTKELREDVCEYAVQNHAYSRSDPRKYS